MEVYTAMRDILSYWDPIRADRWLQDPKEPQGQQPPLYVVMEGLQEQLTQLGQGLGALNEEQKSMQQDLEKVIKFLQAQSKQEAPASAAA